MARARVEQAYVRGARLPGTLMPCPPDVVNEARALLEVLVNNRLREHRAVIAEARERLTIIRLAAEGLKASAQGEFVHNARALCRKIDETCAWLAKQEARLNRPVGETSRDTTVH